MVAPRYQTAYKLYPYEKAPDQDRPPVRHPVVVIGCGPVGMALALDLGLKGTPVLVLDDHDGVGLGSRAICFAKRTLEISDRLGCGKAMRDKGVVWNIGKVFHRNDQIFEFNLQPQGGHQNPAFINLQQPYFEKMLVEQVRRAQTAGAPIEIRGGNRVTNLRQQGHGVQLEIETPDGPYRLDADWVVACDGAASPTRDMLNITFDGRVFEDNFLIADVKMEAEFPTERWFWFEPPFEGAGQSALLHKQPDDIWRIDFQLGWDIDRDAELKPDKIRQKVDAMLGPNVEYELEWTSIYTFQCRRVEKFRHGRILFAGDSAHQVSPFGARGANSGIQDADNLAWKLDLVVNGLAPDTLLDSYCTEREQAADENILNSTRATDFLTPKSVMSKIFRNAVLDLAGRYDFAKPLVNSGRLSVPTTYETSVLSSPDLLDGPPVTRPGAPCQDAPIHQEYLLPKLGNAFVLLTIDADAPDELEHAGLIVKQIALSASDDTPGHLRERYLGDAASAIYLIRPDQHVAARWARYDEAAVKNALSRAIGKAG